MGEFGSKGKEDQNESHRCPNTTLSNMSDNSSFSYFDCFASNIGITISSSILITKIIVILFVSIPILYVGYQQWQQQQRSMATTSHSDIIIYNMTVIELIFVLGTIVNLCGTYARNLVVALAGMYAASFVYPGELLFNTVTCLEHYLAVVHPITYLGLRQPGGVRIRNICIGFVWLLCFGWLGVQALCSPAVNYIPYLCVTLASLIIVSFFCLSVLCALIRPGPGEMGADRKKLDQSKQKAFYTITAIMIVLLVSFLVTLIAVGLSKSYLLSNTEKCAILLSGNWFTLPISLILPLLFLQRKGKLSCSFFSKK